MQRETWHERQQKHYPFSLSSCLLPIDELHSEALTCTPSVMDERNNAAMSGRVGILGFHSCQANGQRRLVT